jgi:RND family efflux transporter MFP subunit
MNMRLIVSLFAVFCLVLAVPKGVPGAAAAEAAKQPAKSENADTAKKKKQKGGTQPTLVGIDAVREEPLSQTVPILGRLVPMRAGNVSAEIAGAVRNLTIAVGDRLKKGELIAELDSISAKARLELLSAEIAQAEADVTSLEAEHRLISQELERQTKLKKSGAFSRAKFEDAIQKVAKAEANVLRARAIIAAREANKRLTEIVIRKTRIKAPYDGVVLRKLTEQGGYVRAGDPVVSLIADRDLEIEADVPSNRLGGLVAGTEVPFVLEDGSRHTALVRSVLPTENPMTRTRPVRFSPKFKQEMSGLANAQTVTIEVPVGAMRQVVTVHKDAIIQRGGRNLVYVISDLKAEPRRIKIGEASGPRVEVLDGLKPGDDVVVRGNERLRPGAPVKIRKGS